MSFRFIEDHRKVFPVRVMCAVLEVSASHWHLSLPQELIRGVHPTGGRSVTPAPGGGRRWW
jgi:hypothetical protein